VDLHCHILPGLDDGARTTGDALAHARRLDAAGELGAAA
jgi:tyrosine-protein phosphatase YwqE